MRRREFILLERGSRGMAALRTRPANYLAGGRVPQQRIRSGVRRDGGCLQKGPEEAGDRGSQCNH